MPRGGYRPGSGQKPAGYVQPKARADFEQERAEHERVKKEQRAHRLAVERGEFLPRAPIRQASATALAVLTQSLRSIPDNLERKLALPPDVVEQLAVEIDAALSECAAAFRAMTPGGDTVEQ
jgi:hypothetical protein